MDFATLFVYGFVILCAGLMIRFVVGCLGQIAKAATIFQTFTVVLKLLLGIILFPFTIMFQAMDIAFD